MPFFIMLGALALMAATPTSTPAPVGSIYGKVAVEASYYLTEPSDKNGFARRQATPAISMREPLGVIVALEGEALTQEKFDAPTEEIKIEAKAFGLEPHLIGCQVGSPLAIINHSPKALKLLGSALLKESIAPEEVRKIVLSDIGVFELTDADQPDVKVTLIVNQNPFVIALDETGEFLFEDLLPGPYQLKVFTRSGAQKVRVDVKPKEREQINIPLKAASKEAP